MGFVKIVKTTAYYSRFQVKFRRRRDGKTDYYARKRLICQDKTKYNSPKYRLVVRFTNREAIVQIVAATLVGDRVLSAAYSRELTRFGLKVPFSKDYAAAYATGLLAARRLLAKLGMAGDYEGNTDINGEHYQVEQVGSRRPFYVLLDVGLHCTTTGARVFGAMKGAADGGLEVPHNTKRFPGYNAQDKKFNAEVLRKYIFGGHVAQYMREIEGDSDRYARQFANYVKAGVKADDVEPMWTAIHAAIRANPEHVPTKKPEKPVHKRFNKKALNRKQRKDRIQNKIAQLQTAAQ